MSKPLKDWWTVTQDPRVLDTSGGGNHDWLYVATMEDAAALIEEYGLRVKYEPYVRERDGLVIFAVR